MSRKTGISMLNMKGPTVDNDSITRKIMHRRPESIPDSKDKMRDQEIQVELETIHQLLITMRSENFTINSSAYDE